MNVTELLPIIKNVEEARDDLARGVIAELLLISRIPDEGPIAVEDLIEVVLEDSRRVQTEILFFDFAYWAQGTVLEVIDFLIICNCLEGPMVNMTTESHKLLEASVKRTKYMKEYIAELRDEIAEYDDILGDVCDD